MDSRSLDNHRRRLHRRHPRDTRPGGEDLSLDRASSPAAQPACALPGGESIVNRFLPLEAYQQYDYVLRLDSDVSFDAGFTDLLRAEFERDPRLGIASPTLWEPAGSTWHEVRQPEYHTRGPAKMYSIDCFTAIGELDPEVGWDTLDEKRRR